MWGALLALLFAEVETGWVATLITAIAGGIILVWQQVGKQKSENRTAEAEQRAKDAEQARKQLDYLFLQYQEYVRRVREEHEGDKKILSKLETDHISTREQLATMTERNAALEKKIAWFENQVGGT